MIKRNDLYKTFKSEYNLSEVEAQRIFKTISNKELTEQYGLTEIRKGYFIQKTK
jgi:hypothetical protein